MSPSRQTVEPRQSPRLRIISNVLLLAYWAILLTATHLPQVPAGVARSDKLIHFAAFAVLGLLLGFWLTVRGAGAGRFVLLLLAVSLYAAIDEATQPLSGRHGDVRDWIADTLGAAVGLAIAAVVCRFMKRRRNRSE